MNRNAIRALCCAAVGAALFPAFNDRAYAGCNPPHDVSSCRVVRWDAFATASPDLPEPPFVVSYPRSKLKLLLTYFHLGSAPAAPAAANNGCNPLNTSACPSVSSSALTSVDIAKTPGPFLVKFQDGRSLLASQLAPR